MQLIRVCALASYQDSHHLICTIADPVRLWALQKSQTWGQIPVFLFEQNLGGEGKKGHAWKELRYVSEYPGFYYRKDCSSTKPYSAVCLRVPPQLPGRRCEETARAEQSSTTTSKFFFAMVQARHGPALLPSSRGIWGTRDGVRSGFMGEVSGWE